MYAGVKELERRRVDGRVSLGLRRYEARIYVDSPPSHFSNTSRNIHVNIYIYIYTHIYIYIRVLRTRGKRLLAAAYIALLDNQC